MSTLAEQIAEKYGLPTKDTPMVENADWTVTPKWPDTVEQKSVIPALSEMRRITWAEAIEAAAKQFIADSQVPYTGRDVVARIRSLKSEVPND